MNILIVTDGSLLGIADRLNSEGHNVFIYPRGNLGTFEGRLYQLQTNLHKGLQECRLVIGDNWEFLDNRARYANRPVIGSNHIAALPNEDIFRQYTLFKRFEVSTPVTEQFSDITDALETAVKWEAHRTVIRYGKSEFRCDYKDWLAWAMTKMPIGQKILFQQLMIGYEAILTGWFDGIGWLDCFSVAPKIRFDLNRFAAVAPLANDSLLVKESFNRLTEYFKHWEYKGPVHFEVVVTEKEFVVQTMHVGFLFPLDYTIFEFVQDEFARFINGLAFSTGYRPLRTKDYVGVVQATRSSLDIQGAPILGLNPERRKHLVFHNVTIDMLDGSYQVGDGPVKEVFTAYAHGPNVGTMCDRVYQTAEAVKFPEKHYTGNMAAVVSPTFEKLKAWGYI